MLTASVDTLLSPLLSLAQTTHGNGVIAVADIHPGDILVRVPASLCITARRARRTPGVAHLLEATHQVEAHVAIAVWLMHAVHVRPPSHVPWLDTLPETFDCTLSWSAAEVAQLQASPSRRRAEAIQQWAGEEWRRIFEPPPDVTSRTGWSTPAFKASRARFDWALCAVWSRSFQYRCGTDDCDGDPNASGGVWRVLAPVADLLNHAAPAQSTARLEIRAHDAMPERWHSVDEAQRQFAQQLFKARAEVGEPADAMRRAEWRWRREEVEAAEAAEGTEEALLLLASRPIAVGEAAELDYGARANAEMLTTHGFATLDNPHEELPLALAPSADDELGPIKSKILAAGNITSPFALSVAALSSDSDLLVALRLLVATPVELKQYAGAFKGERLSARNERRWRQMLTTRVTAMLEAAEAQTDAAHDEELLRLQDGLSGRERMAVVTRLGEKRLLRSILAELERRRAEVTASTSSNVGGG